MKKVLLFSFFCFLVLLFVGKKNIVYGSDIKYGVIRFHTNILGNEKIVEKKYKIDNSTTTFFIPSNWKNKNYVFAGWSKNKNTTTPEYRVANDIIPSTFFKYSSVIDLYAIWVPIDETYGNIVFIGDSYVNSSKWPKKIASLLNIGNSYTIVHRPGTGFINRANGIGDLGGGTKINFMSLLAYSDYIIANNDQVKYIVIMAGYNDYSYDKNTLKQAILSFAKEMHRRFPNAVLYIGMVGTNFKDANIETKLLTVTAPAYKEAADSLSYVKYIPYNEKNSISGYLRWFGNIGDNTYSNGCLPSKENNSCYYWIETTSTTTHTMHPSAKTGDIIANIATQFIKNNLEN